MSNALVIDKQRVPGLGWTRRERGEHKTLILAKAPKAVVPTLRQASDVERKHTIIAMQMKSFMLATQLISGQGPGEIIEGSTYRLTSSSKPTFSGADIPLDLVPKDARRSAVDEKVFRASALVPDEVREAMLGKPFLIVKVRPETLSMVDVLVPVEASESREASLDQMLSALYQMQEVKETLRAERETLRSELKAGLEEYIIAAEELDERGNARLYLYEQQEGIESRSGNRVSVSRSRKLKPAEARKWIESQDESFDSASLMKLVADANVLKKQYPDIYKVGQHYRGDPVIEEI